MTNRPSFSELPEEHKPIDDAQWAQTVVSDALVQANTPDPDDGWVNHDQSGSEADKPDGYANAAQTLKADSGEPSRRPHDGLVQPSRPKLPPLPPALKPATVAAAVPMTAPARQPAPQHQADLAQQPRRAHAARELTVELPTLASDAGTVESETPTLASDAVMVESEASVEGFRASELRTIVEWLFVIFLALAVAVLAKQFVVQAFWIPTASMETTVNVGDRVLVNKVSYRFHDVRRGDLVVFGRVEGTPGNTEDLIKRAVALPGETIELRSDGRLWIWGPGETPEDALLLNEPYLDVQNELLSPPSPTDGPTADIWHENCVNDSSNSARCTLDSNSYFMMGDNRSQSFDSRGFGPVPEENVLGRAFFRIWPVGNISTL